MNRLTLAHSYVFLIASILSLVTLIDAFAQQTPGVSSVRLSRFSDLLLEPHIELTKPALLAALKNSDSDVRFLAAMKLAEDKAIDTIPAVKKALVVEETPRVRVNIAVAPGLLGDAGGHDELKKLCGDKTFPLEFRLYAVRYMFDLGVGNDEDCLHAAEEIVQIVDSENRTFGYRITALELLSRFQNLRQEEWQTVLELAVRRLEDSEPVVQMEASRALADLGNRAAIRYLEAAVARMRDNVVRSALEAT
jgi:HEAT repeat protein